MRRNKTTRKKLPADATPVSTSHILKRAVTLHQSGQPEEAARLYEEVLARNGDHPDALHLLGMVRYHMKLYDEAERLVERAVAAGPHDPVFHNSLGAILRERGDRERARACFDEAIRLKTDYAEALSNRGSIAREEDDRAGAIALFEKAIDANPRYAEAHYNLGNALAGEGRLEEAVQSYAAALQVRPAYPAAVNNKGKVLADLGRFDEAVACYKEAVALNPRAADAFLNLATLLYDRGVLDEAERYAEQMLELNPRYPEALYTMGNICKAWGRLADAVSWYRRAVEVRPAYPAAHNNLGNTFTELNNLDEAFVCYRRAIDARPDYADAWNNLANVYRHRYQFGEARRCYDTALRHNPRYAQAMCNLGNVCKEEGRPDDACYWYEKSLDCDPGAPAVFSNLLLALHYRSQLLQDEIFERHREWADRFGQPASASVTATDTDPVRRLRIGYVSPDFHRHSVAYFIEPVLVSHDRDAVEVFCYSNSTIVDDVTERFKKQADGWRNIYFASDDEMADMIRADRIDILVDLAGHTGGNRLPVFARKPAPLQVSYLGYPDTTGLPQMDYRLTDEWADPPGETDRFAVETLVRLPWGFLCYRPSDEAPPVATPPSKRSGYVTFGSFNLRAKMTPAVFRLWADILAAVPDSRVIIKSRTLIDKEIRAGINQLFVSLGIASDRVRCVSYVPSLQDHLALYNQVDIALDTFPYHGTTTTCEALWMGVPVIVRAGEHHVSRVGVSLLHTVGLDEFVTVSDRDYVACAVALAHDEARRESLRHDLRQRMAASPLMDAAGFTRNLEKAYRGIWEHYGRARR